MESSAHPVQHWKDDGRRLQTTVPLLREEPLWIRVQEEPYTVVMRTPGDEIPHAAGFCLGEGIVESPEEFEVAMGESENMVEVTLKPPRTEPPGPAGVGLDGKAMISDLVQSIGPLRDDTTVDISETAKHFNALANLQPVRRATKSAHAAAIFSADFELLSSAEDVGRNNALDKAVGKLFLKGGLGTAAVMFLSSRMSHELVRKAGRAKIPVILSKSRPTALAVALAGALDMTLACGSREAGILVFCGGRRLRGCP